MSFFPVTLDAGVRVLGKVRLVLVGVLAIVCVPSRTESTFLTTIVSPTENPWTVVVSSFATDESSDLYETCLTVLTSGSRTYVNVVLVGIDSTMKVPSKGSPTPETVISAPTVNSWAFRVVRVATSERVVWSKESCLFSTAPLRDPPNPSVTMRS